MPQPKNTLLRALVPILLILIGIGVAWAVFVNSRKQGTTTPGSSGSAAPVTAGAPAAATGSSGPTASTGGQAATGVVGATGPSAAIGATGATGVTAPSGAIAPMSPYKGLHARAFAESERIGNFDPIGSMDAASSYEAQVEFTTLGAGIKTITLAHQFETIEKKRHTVVQQAYSYTPPPSPADPAPATAFIAPMAADSVEIDGQVVSLLGYTEDPAKGRLGSPVWRQTAPGTFEAEVVDGQDTPVARVQRTYSIAPGSYQVKLEQRVVSLAKTPLAVKWFQYGPGDLEQDNASYGGDKRRVRFGYLFKPQAQGNDPTVLSDEFVTARSGELGPARKDTTYEDVRPIWPNPTSTTRGFRIVWTGMTNRYFGASIYPLVPPNTGPDQKVFTTASTVDRVLLHRWLTKDGRSVYDPVMVLRTAGETVTIAPGAAADLSMGLYAGPLSRPIINAEPAAAAVALNGLVVYNYGGMCAWCTFGFLTGALLWLLRIFATYVVFDWGLAIILLVLLVRTCLHPVTKWSQIRMARFGKQMQEMGPKQKKIQEKFKDDPQRLREETARLWKEQGISPTGFLGCLPGFIQSPVWIALSSMLFFAFDLRQTPAFFGVFQRVTSGVPWLGWMHSFLGDLAEPDRFVDFGRVLVTLPILNQISSINLLPLLLGVVFFLQQKYLTPPTTTQMTPEQEQQQKIMRVMMVVMFPLMMYSAPSGLALYFICNSTLAILESRYIRSHIDKYDLLNKRNPPGAGGVAARAGGGPKPGGFMARLQELAERRQQEMMKRRGMTPPRKRV